MEYLGLLAIAVCILLAGTISRRIQGTIITLPMVYTLFGILLGGLVLNLVPLTPEDRIVELLAEVTLVIVLATDASRIDVAGLRKDHNLPTRLLGFGLPLTMVLGTIGAALIFSDLSLWEAAILAVILTPTDASLGQSVVSNPKVPVRIRQTLNIESGLNDGIAMPFLLLVIALAKSEITYHTPIEFLLSVLVQIALAIAAGILVGYLGMKLIKWGRESGWMSETYQQISSLALILVVYGLAEMIGGNGFIAAFVFGLTSRYLTGKQASEDLYEYAETELTVLMLITFVLFGAVMLPPALSEIHPEYILYAVLSLTLVRMLSVYISLIGAGVRKISSLFIGWFGPRGIASILYIFIVLESESLPSLDLIYSTAIITILISIFAHGITAAPGANSYGAKMTELKESDSLEIENKQVKEMPLRTAGQ